ncbi:acyltransferase [Microbacterium esteraromaticum]|uniref:Acyltransferase n=1 Tax=Microbacterium esteraromaticum TaxID=57043 RepID=A0A7D8AJZ3_9MICO|nr:acyltransferase [Microbacterium esteraromaticum]QMU97725.1 acyltransferase [Microbacterium esteraromaticum]
MSARVAVDTRTGGRSWLDPRDNSLNLLRLIMATMVVFHHVFPLTARGEGIELTPGESVGGWAVFGFFMISGYLITGARIRSDSGRYLINRIVRLFPAFFFVNILTAFLLAPIAFVIQNGSLQGFLSTPNTPFSYVISNAWLRMNDYSVAGTLADVPYPLAWNGSLWSLYYEFCAYLLIGLFCAIPVVRTRIWPMLLAFLATCALKVWDGPISVYLSGIDDDVVQFGRLLPFFFGGALVFMLRERLGDRLALDWRLVIVSIIATVGLVLLFPRFGAQLAAPFLTYVLIWIGSRLPSPRIFQVQDFSYGIYVWGFPLTQLLCLLGLAQAPLPLIFAILLPLTAIMAVISWFLVERPAIRWSRGKARPFGDIRAEAR